MSVSRELLGEREVDSARAMEELGERLGEGLRAGDVIVLTGPLGAGKTTLTRGLARALDVRGPIQSPTFVLARTHPSLSDGPPLVHIDAYRLGTADELEDLDVDVAHSVVVAEWAAPFVAGLTDHWWEVEISREWHGRGVDTACGTYGHGEDLDAETPRRLVITEHHAG